MGKGTKEKKRCPICDSELDEDEDICPECGCCIEEPCYDAIDDEGN